MESTQRSAPRRDAFRRLAIAWAAAAMAYAPSVSAQPAADPAGSDTVATVAVAGWDRLMADLDYLAELVGQPKPSEAAKQAIQQVTGGKGLPLDRDRPLGLVLRSVPGGEFQPVLCLPVTDLPALLGYAALYGVSAEETGGGVTKITVPRSPEPAYAKAVGQWVFAAMSPEALDNPPANPAALFEDLVETSDVAGRVFLQNIPAMLRETAVSSFESAAEMGMRQQPGEDDEDYAKRKRLAELQIAQLRSWLTQTSGLSIDLTINGPQGRGVTLDLGISAEDGSALFNELRSGAGAQTALSAFDAPDATLRFGVHDKIGGDPEQLEASIEIARQQFLDAINNDPSIPNAASRQVFRDALELILQSLSETVASRKLDGALSVDIKRNGFRLLGGVVVQSADKIEAGLKKLAEMAANNPGGPQIDWNAESHAGVRFHTLTAPIPPVLPLLEDMLGSELQLAIGIGDERVYLAAGEGWFARIAGAIDASAGGQRSVPPVQVVVAVGDLVAVASQVPGQAQVPAQVLADALAATPGEDHLGVVFGPTPSGARLRLTIEEGIFKAAGAIAPGMMMGRGLGGPGGMPPAAPPQF